MTLFILTLDHTCLFCLLQIVTAAVEQEWKALRFASRGMKDNQVRPLTDDFASLKHDSHDEECSFSHCCMLSQKVVQAAVDQNPKALHYASNRLKGNKLFVQRLVEVSFSPCVTRSSHVC